MIERMAESVLDWLDELPAWAKFVANAAFFCVCVALGTAIGIWAGEAMKA